MLGEKPILSPQQWEQIVQLWEEYLINSNSKIQTSSIQSQAYKFIKKKRRKLTSSDRRRYRAKIQKLKNSKSRSAKLQQDKLLKGLQQVL